jgi:hypothetical protein
LAALLNRLPVVGIPAVVVDRVRTGRIVFKAICRGIWRAIVEERANGGLFVEDADSTPHNQVTLGLGAIGEAESRRKIVPVRRVDGTDAGSLYCKGSPGYKNGQVPIAIMERTTVFVAKAEIKRQCWFQLPRILPEHIE